MENYKTPVFFLDGTWVKLTMSNFSRIGVSQKGIYDWEPGTASDRAPASRDFSNDFDYASPGEYFTTVHEDGSETGKVAALFMTPFWKVGNPVYGITDAVGIPLYVTNMVIVFLGCFLYCFGSLAIVYIVGNAQTGSGLASFIVATSVAAFWAAFCGFWPYDDRLKHNLNPIIGACRVYTSDQGIISAIILYGIMVVAALAAGKSIGHLGWNAWTTGPVPPVGQEYLRTVLPYNNYKTMGYGLSFFAALFIAVTYTFNEKFESQENARSKRGEARNWTRTVIGTTLAIFWATLIGYQLGFKYVGNPMLSMAAYFSNGGWTTQSPPGSSLRDSVYFLCIEYFAVPAACALLYYIVRFGIFLDQRNPQARITFSRGKGRANRNADNQDEGSMELNEARIGRRAPQMSSGMKKRRN